MLKVLFTFLFILFIFTFLIIYDLNRNVRKLNNFLATVYITTILSFFGFSSLKKKKAPGEHKTTLKCIFYSQMPGIVTINAILIT